MSAPAPVALLLDADGVVQANPPGWRDDVAAVVPPDDREAFLADLFTSERESMVGRARFVDVLDAVCGRWGIADRAADLLRQWCRVDVDPEMLHLVEALRDAGTPCVLVSNQNDHRAAFLREELGYDDRFDHVYVSCDLGTTKADPGFFTRVAYGLGAEPASLLVVDDAPANVESARRAGLRGEVWTLDDGQQRLATLLAGHGLVVPPRP